MTSGLVRPELFPALAVCRRSAAAVLLLCASGCGALMLQKRPTEFRSASVPAGKFRTIAVIARDDSGPTLRMSVGVREQLTEAGLEAIRRAGRWDSEKDALEEICQPAEQVPVDGVLFVTYDQLTLRDCATKSTAYDITAGSTLGLQQMTGRLIQYLRAGAES